MNQSALIGTEKRPKPGDTSFFRNIQVHQRKGRQTERKIAIGLQTEAAKLYPGLPPFFISARVCYNTASLQPQDRGSANDSLAEAEIDTSRFEQKTL